MKLVNLLGTILAVALLMSNARSQNKPAIEETHSDNKFFVLCGDGLAGGDCELARGMMRVALGKLRASIPDWRFVVIAPTEWNNAADRFRVPHTTPAFSSVRIRTTYVEANLLFNDGRVDENLQRYTGMTGLNRLIWVMAHEYGHILCQTTDEHRATAAAGRLIYGKGQPCR